MHPRHVLATAVMTAGLVLGFALPATAHAEVVATSPTSDSTVNGTITEVSVTFDEAVSLVPHALALTTDVGIPVALETPRLSDQGKVLSAQVQDHLARGRYAVAWRAQADDGHLENSTFSFSVAAGAGQAAGTQTSAAPPPLPPAPADPLWPVFVAAGVALAGGVGAGVAVRRGLRVVAVRGYADEHTVSRRDHETSRLPM